MDQDEITWKDLIMELIKSEQMDPWDIDISDLTKKFIQTIKKLKELNIRISGKVLLAAALLLRIKSTRLVGEDILEFDRLLASGGESDLYSDEDYVEDELGNRGVAVNIGGENMQLVPKTPQPRKRKVSVYDLVDALNQALEVRKRRVKRHREIEELEVHIPTKKYDISELIGNIYQEIIEYLWNKKIFYKNL